MRLIERAQAIDLIAQQGTDIVIPDGVNSIRDEAFSESQLTSVTFPDSITSIGSKVFSQNQLTSIVIPGLHAIEREVFAYNQLTRVGIPDSVGYVAKGAFAYNQIIDVVIPSSVKWIGEEAFAYNQLTHLRIPEGVTSIRQKAFADNRLTRLVIPSSLTSIGEEAFSQNLLTSLVIPDGVTSIGEEAFAYNQLTSVVIPGSVTSIGEEAFSQNQLTSLVIPDGVTSIEQGAFANNQLTSLVIPDGVISIKYRAFANNQLTSLVIPDSVNYIDGGAFDDDLQYVSVSEDAPFPASNLPVGAAIDYRGVDQAPTDISSSSSSFDENIIDGSAVGTLSSKDPDIGDTHTYSLITGTGDTDNSAFIIDGDQLKIVNSPDYETKSSYSIRIKTTDSSGLTFEKDFRLRVNNLYEKSTPTPEPIPEPVPTLTPEPTPVSVPTPEPIPTLIPKIQSIDDIATQNQVTKFQLTKSIRIQNQQVEMLISGTDKKDKITGSTSNEVLTGGTGKDVLKGGGGSDGFLFDAKGFGKKNADKILDFNPDEDDSILVDKDVFDLGKKVKLKTVASKKALKKASKTKNPFVYDERKGFLYFNENGKESGWGDGGLLAIIQGKPELGASDFTIV